MRLLSKCCKFWSSKSFSTCRNIAYIPFPICTTGDKTPNTIYCCNLGEDWRHPFSLKLQQHCVSNGFQFTRFQYRYTEVPNTLWSIDSWIEDILLLIDRFYDMRGPVNLISRGAGANAALRAAICKWQQCCRINVSVRPDKLNALVFISPAVGVDLEYFNRLSPNSVKLMRQGETAVVPSITNGPTTQLTYRSVLAYKNDCVVNRCSSGSIGLNCPIGIIHGLDDNIVSYENSINMLRKLQSSIVFLELIKNQGHHFADVTPQILNMIDDVLLKLYTDDKMTPNPTTNFDPQATNFTGEVCEIVNF